MVFKRGVAMLALAAAATVATTEARDVEIKTSYEHPVVKQVKAVKGGVEIVLGEGADVERSGPKAVEHKKGVQHFPKDHKKETHKKKSVPKPVEHKKGVQHFPKDHKKETHKKKSVPKPVEHKKGVQHHKEAKPVEHKKGVHHQKEPKPVEHKKGVQHFKEESHKKKEHKKESHKKQVSQVKKPDGEIVKKYKHGQVRIKANNQPPADHHKKASHKKETHKKHKKVIHKKQVDSSAGGDYEEADVDLESGETVTLTFGEHEVELTLLKNGSLVLVADNETTVLPPADSVDLDIQVDDTTDEEASSSSAEQGDVGGGEGQGTADSQFAMVARKFAEFATKVTGDGKYISKEAAPIVFVAGVVGALAAVVGIAAYAVGRARDRAADPQSVLSDAAATEDVEAAATQESTEDAEADDSESLASSDSEDETIEEGKFTNEVASV